MEPGAQLDHYEITGPLGQIRRTTVSLMRTIRQPGKVAEYDDYVLSHDGV